MATLVFLSIIGLPQVYKRFGPSVTNTVLDLRSGHLSRVDAAALERGYYEHLTRVDRFNSQLWELYMNRPALHWLDVSSSGLTRMTGDFLQEELAPSFESSTAIKITRRNLLQTRIALRYLGHLQSWDGA
jgi:hypothetical protein